ncbi:MAG TPA: hypothetical protein IGR64_12720 [Leptolyngbyaceae cyanobacterium M65_K2018_010]|nr:hypothetical protein [Leptolyngbyaceae cyanobacterium M65_K2018_010]
MLITHDRYFLDRTVNTIFAFEGNGLLRQYPGNYSLYLDYKQAEQDQAQAARPPQPNGPQPKVASGSPRARPGEVPSVTEAKPKKLSYKEKREYEQLEQHIADLEAEKDTVEQQLYHHPSADYGEISHLSEQLAQLSAAIDAATERWLELAERVEA